MKKTITLLMLLALVMPLWAGERTITISRNDVDWESANTVYNISKGGVQLVMSGGMNNPNFLLMKQQTTITVKSLNFNIKKIVFHCLDNFTNDNLDPFYWGPKTLHIQYSQTHGETAGTLTYNYGGSSYDACWVSTKNSTPGHYPDGLPTGYELMFYNEAKPVRFASIDITVEQETGDLYELVTDKDEIEFSTASNKVNYMIVGRENATTTTGNALSVNQYNSSTSGNFLSTPVELIDNGYRARATGDVMFISFIESENSNYPYYVIAGDNYFKTESSYYTSGDESSGYRLVRLPSIGSMDKKYFNASVDINTTGIVTSWGYYATIKYEGTPNFSIRHYNSYSQFRNLKTSAYSSQRAYLYKPSKQYKVTTEVQPDDNHGSISLRDGILVETIDNEVVNWSQKMETIQFLVTPANGKRIANVTIAYEGDETTTISPLTVTPSINGTLYTFEMPAHNVHIVATFEDVVYHNIYTDVKPNVTYGNIFLTEGYVVQQDQVKSYDGETVVFNVTPNPKDPDNANSEYYELYSVVVKNDITGEEIPYTYADGNYTFTMPDANVTITATFIYENGAPLYLLGTANGNETWLPYGPRFNYDPNRGQYYLDVYFKGVGEYGDTENYDQYGYFSFVWKYATSWDEINNKNLRGVPMTNGTMVNTSSDGFQLFYNPRNNANESNSFKIPAGIYRFYVKSYSEGNDWLYVTQSPISLTYNPAGGADATSAVEVPQHQLVTMSGDLYSKIKAINPDESDGNFKYQATIGGVTEPQTEIAGASTSNIATLDVVNDGETVTELAGTNYLGWIHADKTAYYKVINTPLNWIERNGEKDKTYTVADQLQGVYAKDGHLWCKDLGDISIVKTEPATGQVDYVTSTLNTLNHRFENNMRNGNWDQSNWVELDFTGVTNDAVNVAQSFVNKLITAGSVKGVYSDDVNYTITLTSLPTTGDVATYVPNTYYTNNFIEANLTATGVAEGGKNYYFLNPKVQEYAIITYAMWDVENQIMVAPSVSPFNGAAVLGRWDLNESGNELERLDDAAQATTTANNEYEFHIIVQRANKSYGSPATTTQGVAGLKAETPTPKAGQTASAVIMAQPLDLQASSPLPTAINGVVSNAQPVNVEYINLAGVRSSKPFSGVNIVVTRYTDDSTTTTKVIKK